MSTNQPIRRLSPRATIGQTKRFLEPPAERYKSVTPCEYRVRPQIDNSKMGTIGKEKRFVEAKFKPPGVGQYNLLQFKNLA